MKTIGLFIPCFIDMFYPNVALATMTILQKYGFDVIYPKAQSCCGQPLFNSGYQKEAQKSAERFYEIFSQYDYIVAPSASCIAMVKVHYQKLLPPQQYETLKKRSFEIVEFLHDIVQPETLEAHFQGAIALHRSCHGLRELQLSTPKELNLPYHDKVTDLLQRVKGLEIRVMQHAEECCGFGGTFSLHENALSVKMAKEKIENFEKSGADYFAGYDSSCMMHLKSVSDYDQKEIKYLHIIEILAGLKK